MVNLIIDLSLHAPNLKYIIKNSLYYGEEKGINFSSNHSNQDLISQFNINLNEEKEKIIKLNEIDNLFFVMSVLSSEQKHQGNTYSKFIEMYKSSYDKFYGAVSNKIILIKYMIMIMNLHLIYINLILNMI